MRYAAGLFYALAIAAHSGQLLDSLALGALVFLGVVCTLFAVEGIVQGALKPPARSGWSPPAADMRPDLVAQYYADVRRETARQAQREPPHA